MVCKMLLPRFDFEAPEDLGQASRLLAQAGGDVRVLAGGTDLVVKMKRRDIVPRLVVSLARVGGLGEVEPIPNGGLRIGALATMCLLAADAHLAAESSPFVALREGASVVGGPLIRNRATVGGNIVNARPCADTVPPLLALGARLHLATAASARAVDLDGFITGPGQCKIANDEILTHIELPPPSEERVGSSYIKITRRAAMEVTTAGCAASVVLDDSGRSIVCARVVLASVAPTALAVPAVADVLVGRAPDEPALAHAARAARDAAQPIDDHRAPGDYRRDVIEVITLRALRKACERAVRRRAP